MASTDSPRGRERRGAAGCGFAAVVIAALLVAGWLLWGFRWPPTAGTMLEPPTDDAEVVDDE
jgi:hypothetical protein